MGVFEVIGPIYIKKHHIEGGSPTIESSETHWLNKQTQKGQALSSLAPFESGTEKCDRNYFHN